MGLDDKIGNKAEELKGKGKEATGKATNLKISWSGLPIYGFGSDADGEAYVLTSSPTGQGVFRLAPATKAAAR